MEPQNQPELLKDAPVDPVLKLTDNETNKKAKKIKKKKPFTKKQKIILIVTASVLFLLMVGSAILLFILSKQTVERAELSEPVKIYSKLTGEEIASEDLNSLPTFCVQTPNGMDGARPQVGLNQAGVVFEAIAEAGITRFAAIYQNPTSSAIGPIRSLRTYYLEWDTPFDCTIVHAGGSAEAIAAVSNGEHRDLTESTEYMWRDHSTYSAPNNLFTSPKLLTEFNTSKKYDKSSLTAFPRLTPSEAYLRAIDNYDAAHPESTENTETNEATENSTDQNQESKTPVPLVESIAINFGSQINFNTIYTYNSENNSYIRSYANGNPHLVYTCPENIDQIKPGKDCGEPSQVAPKAVVAMMVQESTASDNYHQNITTIGTGEAYIFQNGEAIKGTWTKKSAKEQIEFKNADGETISFTPGQLWIAAVPQYGSVKY